MKRNLLKMQQNIVAILTTITMSAILCAFTMVDREKTEPPTETKPIEIFTHLNPQPDSVIVSILGEDAAGVVFGTKMATLSHLNPTEPPADNEATIGGVKVVKTLGTLNKADLNVIRFLMADSAFYNNGPVTVTSPYEPNYALSFNKGKQKVDLVFSLVSFEMGIVVNGKLTKVVRYNNARQVTRFFRNVSQNEFYDKIIEIQ